MLQKTRTALGLLASFLLAFPAARAEATSMLPQTIVDLIHHSESIVVGDVLRVTDGIDGAGVPYTEVSLEVQESLKGSVSGVYTFRQFGLLAPKEMPNGFVNLNVSPDGWPSFVAGEKVVVFLYQKAAWTGLQTTVGLFQGKFNVKDGRVTNALQNRGLFHKVVVDEGLLSPEEKKLVATRGPADSGAFVSFVKKAVKGRWVELGRIADAQN